MIIILSILLNILLLFKLSNMIDQKEEEKLLLSQKKIDKIYHLGNYQSYADQSSNLDLRFNKLYKSYLKDKTKPKRSFYNAKKELDGYWRIKCIHTLRKIHNIHSRIEDIEFVISEVAKIDPEVHESFKLLVKNKGYAEKLTEMSNFYAKFISNHTYDIIIKTID